MLIKLIKQDLKSFNRVLLFLYLLSLITSIIVLFTKQYSSDAFVATFLLGTDFSLICMILTLILPFINVFSKIKNSFYKEESYLFHTLPVERKTLYDSKIISSLLTFVISWLIFGICFVNVFSGVSIITYIGAVIDNTNTLNSILSFVSEVGVQFLLLFMSSLLGLIVGYMFDDKKDLLTFIFTIIFFLSSYLIVYSLSSVFKFGNVEILILFLILSLLIYFLGRYLFNKGVNLE